MSEITERHSYHDDLPPDQRSRFRDVCYEMVDSITEAVETYDQQSVKQRAALIGYVAGLKDRSERSREHMIAEVKNRNFPAVIPLRSFDRKDYNERKIEKNLRRFLTEGCGEHFDETQDYNPTIQSNSMCMEIASMKVEEKGYSITLIRNTEDYTKDEHGKILPNAVSYLLVIDPMVSEQALPTEDSTPQLSSQAALA